jgi:MFS family permease
MVVVDPLATPAVDVAPVDRRRVQRHTVSLLVGTQIAGGIGVATGIAVGALLAADLAGTEASGLAGSASVIGAAAIAVPVTRLTRARGRRPGLALAYLLGAVGAVVVVAGVASRSIPLFFLGTFLFGGGSAAGLQARYAAVDLAGPDRRARYLSLVVWATTVGAVVGPNIAPVANRFGESRGLLGYVGPYLLSAVAFSLTATALVAFLRPDPLLVARAGHRVPGAVVPAGAVGRQRWRRRAVVGSWRTAWRAVRANPGARLGIAAVATGHVVMVGVMSMTPVYIGGYEHDHGDVLRVVGLVISVHITGMYALSPLVGWLTDRLGRRTVILGGIGVLLSACAVAGTAGHSTPRLAAGLALVGLGWSGTMVAGSTLLSESVSLEVRPAAQGLCDVVMGVAGASAGALAGVIVDLFGYPTLTLLAAVAAVPLAALASRSVVGRGGTLVGCD